MAKKKNSKVKTEKNKKIQFDNILPQNIVSMGEHVEEDKNIYISQNTYKEIYRFTKDKTTNESGGVLLGRVIEEFGKTNIVICAFIEAKYCEGTPTTLKFTHETWEYVHKEAEKKYPDLKILGWIHTHPNFGIFLSEYDKFIQQNFFSEENQIAYVVDPIQRIEGFYFWINGKIERCKGFFVFDKTGTKITVNNEKDDTSKSNSESLPLLTKVQTVGLSVLTVLLIVACVNMNGKIKTLQKQYENLVNDINQASSVFSRSISELQSEIEVVLPTTTEPSTEATTETTTEEISSNIEVAEVTEMTTVSAEAEATSVAQEGE